MVDGTLAELNSDYTLAPQSIDFTPVGNFPYKFSQLPTSSKILQKIGRQIPIQKIAQEATDRLKSCGRDGDILRMLYNEGLPLWMVSKHSAMTVKSLKHHKNMALSYMAGKRKAMPYDQWCQAL